MNDVEAAARALGRARRVVVLTGAGASAESRIPTYRGGMEGLWKEFDPQTLATQAAFDADPEMVTRWYDWRRMACLEAEPNAGHAALVDLERDVEAAGGDFTLITQNVDRLHARAGSRNVIEIHGNIIQWRCTETDRVVELDESPFEDFPPRSPFAPEDEPRDTGRWLLRPHVVWFGEMLPEQALFAAAEAVESCDVFISAGTSSVVYPAAGFVDVARSRGATTIEVNLEATDKSDLVDHALPGRTGELLPKLVAAAREVRGPT